MESFFFRTRTKVKVSTPLASRLSPVYSCGKRSLPDPIKDSSFVWNVQYPMQVHILPGSENNIVIEWKTNLCYIPFYKFEKCKDDDIVRLIINVSALTSFILQNNNVWFWVLNKYSLVYGWYKHISTSSTAYDYIISLTRGFLWVLQFPPPIILTTSILLKYCWKRR